METPVDVTKPSKEREICLQTLATIAPLFIPPGWPKSVASRGIQKSDVKTMKTVFALLICFILWLGSSATFACSTRGDPPTDEQLFKKASSVFVAHVLRTEEKSIRVETKNPYLVVEAEFRVVEILKGQPPSDGKVRDLVFGPGNCSLGLLAGLDYLFFIQDDQYNFVLWPTGSRPFININGTESVKLLQDLRRLKETTSQ